MKHLTPLKILVFIIISNFLLACFPEVKQFSEKAPFAIEVKRVRSYYDAEIINDRLNEMSIPSYIVTMKDQDDENNEWYVVMTGAETDSLQVAQLKEKITQEFDLQTLVVHNYNQRKEDITRIKEKEITEEEKIEAERPDLPETVYDLVEKFPENNLFDVMSVSLHNFPDENIPRKYFDGFFYAKTDLPRGVTKSIVFKYASAFSEVIFEDNLFGDQVTVDIVKLKENHGIDLMPRAILTQNNNMGPPEIPEHIAYYFASLILNTGKYPGEIIEPIEVESFKNLYGYKAAFVNTETNKLRTYFVLVDIDGEYVIFSQSTDKSDEEILKYLEDFGKSKGILNNNKFYNSFFTIPSCLDEDEEEFLGYASDVLGQSYATTRRNAEWAKRMVGHVNSNAYFYNKKLKKPWVCGSFDLVTASQKDEIYGNLYTKSRENDSDAVKVNIRGRKGFFIENPYIGNEVNFSTSGRHVMAVSGDMNKNKLVKLAKKFQSGKKANEDNPCGE